MRRVLEAPALHFLVLGALLVAADRWVLPDASPAGPSRAAIEIDRARVEELRSGWIARTGAPPDASGLRALVDAEIDDEVLLREARARGLEARDPVVRARLARNIGFMRGEDERAARAGDAQRVDEALALGLERSDLVVRRRLIERMRAELASSAGGRPSEAEIAARFARDRDRFVGAPRVRLSHVFLSRDRHGATLELDARHLWEQVSTTGLAFDAAIARGDAFLLGHELPPRTETELERDFGGAFARAAFALEPGRVSEPIESSYGLHLVLVHERSEAASVPLEAARAGIETELVREHEAAALRGALAELRTRYAVRVDGSSS